MLCKLVLLLFFIFLNTVAGYDTVVECASNPPIFNLTVNSVTLLQSPSFPQTFGGDSLPTNCNAHFVTSGPTTNIWILMLNGYVDEIQFHDIHNTSNQLTTRDYTANFDVVNFTTTSNELLVNAFSSNSQPQWAAYQAIVVTYPQSFDGCPLGGQTFDLSTDENSMIPVTHTFFLPDAELSYKLCDWYFTIATTQQLKVVVRKIDLGDDISLILSDEKGILHIFSEADVDQVFYFEGEKFDFMYEFNHANVTNKGFMIFVSAVTKSYTYTMNGCQPPSVSGQATNYSNIDYVNGYQPYQKCVSAVTISTNYEATLSITEYGFEGISDKLKIYYGTNSSSLITWEPWKTPLYYKLTSDVSGGQLIFTADGNTQGGGYRALLQTYECKCADNNFVFQCDFASYLRPMNGNFPFCSNMDCTYKIIANSSCPNNYFNLGLERGGLRESIDYLLILDDKGTALNITSTSRNTDAYFSPKNNITVQFHSGPSTNPVTTEDKSWLIKIAPISKPNFTKVELDETNSKYVKWLADMKEYEALTVCTSTGTLEIFIPHLNNGYDLRDFYLYDSADLDNFVGSLNSVVISSTSDTMYPIARKSTSGCFTIYLPDFFLGGEYYSVLFQIVDDTQNSCQDSNNIFQIPLLNTSNYDITVTSTDSGSCEMIILTSLSDSTDLLSHIWISNISVSDMEGEYAVYSTENSKKLFTFKGSDAWKFQNFGVYTSALSIMAPPSASITILLTGSFQVLENINVEADSQQKGIMASPSYSGFMRTFNLQSLYQSTGASDFTTTFNVEEINGNAKPILVNNGKNMTLTVGTYTATNSFTLLYEEKNPKNNEFLIEYTIESGDFEASGETTPYFTTTEKGIISTSVSARTSEIPIHTSTALEQTTFTATSEASQTSFSSASPPVASSTDLPIISSSTISSTSSPTVTTSTSSTKPSTASSTSSSTLTSKSTTLLTTASSTTPLTTVSSTHSPDISETNPTYISSTSKASTVSESISPTTTTTPVATTSSAASQAFNVSILFISTLFMLYFH